MHTSILLAILPAVLASANSPLLASRQASCGSGFEACGDHCLPTGYICCDDQSGGCDPFHECQADPAGTTACCINPGSCSGEFDFIPVFAIDPVTLTGVGGDDDGPGVTITDSADLAAFTEAHQDNDDDSDDTPASTTGPAGADDASPTESSTGGAPAMTEAAGLVMAIGAGVAMLL